MKQKCRGCNKWFKNVLLHHIRSPCGAVEEDDMNAAVPMAASMFSNPSETMECLKMDYNLHALAEDNLSMPNTDVHKDKQSQTESYKGMTGYFLRKHAVADTICQPNVPIQTVYESRLQEFIIEGTEDEIDVNDLLDDIQPENESTMNIGGYDSDDHFTINTETPFFPLPQLALDLNEVIEEQLVDGNANNKVISTLAKQIGKIYAPISMFEFY